MSSVDFELLNIAETYAQEEKRAKQLKSTYKGIRAASSDALFDVSGKIALLQISLKQAEREVEQLQRACSLPMHIDPRPQLFLHY